MSSPAILDLRGSFSNVFICQEMSEVSFSEKVLHVFSSYISDPNKFVYLNQRPLDSLDKNVKNLLRKFKREDA